MPAAVEPSRLTSHLSRSSASDTHRPKKASTLPRHAAPHSVTCICNRRGVVTRCFVCFFAGFWLFFADFFGSDEGIQYPLGSMSAVSGYRPSMMRTWHGVPSGTDRSDASWRTISTRCMESATAGCSVASQFGSGSVVTEATSPCSCCVALAEVANSINARMPG